MADWYCSSVAWTAVTQWSAGLTATVGMLRRQLAAPTVGNERVWRCTTAGTTGGGEPGWTLTKGSTTSDNGVVWTEVTGNSSHQQDNGVTNTWTAPHARVENMLPWMAVGDRGFVSSDHTQTSTAGLTLTVTGTGGTGAGCTFVSVNRTTGNVPPIDSDVTSGASIAVTAAFTNLSITGSSDWDGFTFTAGSGSTVGVGIQVGGSAGWYRLRNCTLALNTTGTSSNIDLGLTGSTSIRLDNVTFQFGNAAHTIRFCYYSSRIVANNINFTGTAPSVAFTVGFGSNESGKLEIHSSDLNSLGSNTLLSPSTSYYIDVILNNCRFSSGLTIGTIPANVGSPARIVIINCDSGANGYHNEWHELAGNVTTDTTNTLTGGATDGVQKVDHKFVTGSLASALNPLTGPVMHNWNTLTAGTHTATVEIQSSGTLNTNDVWLEIETLGNSSYPLGTIADCGLATPISVAAAIPGSSATWDASPATPVKQHLQVSFAPRLTGMVVGRVKVAKASTTLYVDPNITIS